MLCYDRIDITKGIDLAKSNNSKECMIVVTIGFLIMDSNFQIMYVMIVMICQC